MLKKIFSSKVILALIFVLLFLYIGVFTTLHFIESVNNDFVLLSKFFLYSLLFLFFFSLVSYFLHKDDDTDSFVLDDKPELKTNGKTIIHLYNNDKE